MILSFLFVFLTIFGSSYGEFPLVPDSKVFVTRADDPRYRLPTSIIPVSYDITLEPLFDEEFIFRGSVTIVVQVEEATNSIILHAANLTIDPSSIVVQERNGIDELIIGVPESDIQFQLYTIPLDEEVEVGTELEISMQFEGVLNEQNKGFYRASYVEEGETKWFATTQFESTSARLAFPCFDEPALKATFTINIIRPDGYTAISNMNLAGTVPENGKFKDTFKESVKMSTYLVAFVVSEMTSQDRDNQKVYAAKYLIDEQQGLYGLDVGIKTIAAIAAFLDVPYTLEKLDQVAIPDGWFSAGAMENWGLVTYRERYLLVKNGVTTSSEKQSVATIIAHELGHQWFGNLVSPLWWSYIWLNEGFATYFEHYASSVVEPEMRTMEQFVIRAHQYAFESDALTTTRPMSQDAQSPEEIGALFDRVAYEKSGSVIRMMEHFLTKDVFRSGLKIYLTNKEFDAAEPTDLWEALQEAVNEDESTMLQDMTVADIMETWNSQAGYPVVNVERNDGDIILSQSRFLLHSATDSSNAKWTIPINYATASNADFSDTSVTYWLKEQTENTDIHVEDDEWIILNKQETGYYRVNYDEENWELISDFLRNSDDFEDIHVLNRAQLIDDALNLARSDRLSYKVALNVILYLSRETDYIPLYSFFRGLTHLHKHILNTEHYDNLKIIVRELLQAAYEKLGTADTGSHTEKLNRVNVLTWLCRYEHEDCMQDTHDILTTTTAASPDLQSVVYCGGLMDETDIEEKWTFLYDRYTGSVAESAEKGRIISALGCTHSVPHLIRLLNTAIGQEEEYTISDSHQTSAFSAVYTSSHVGLETAFDFITNITNFDIMTESLTTSQLNSIYNGISDRLTTSEQRTKLQTFVNSLPGTPVVNFATALSNIQTNIDWSNKYMEDITEWLEENSSAFVFAVSIPLLIIALFSHLLV